ncbi:hypothetical protein [Nocardia gipuzkoensis]
MLVWSPWNSVPNLGELPSTNCNASGNSISEGNITIDCSQKLPEPMTLADVKLRGGWTGDGPFYFQGENLPTPPPYLPRDRSSHCHTWADWIETSPDFFTTDPTVVLGAVAGLLDQVAIAGVVVKVFSVEEFQNNGLPLVQCEHGAGGVPGYTVNVDTEANKSTVKFNPTSESPGLKGEFPLPPASINVKQGFYEFTEINIYGDPRKIYTGQILVTTVLNGVEKSVPIGTVDRPLRWVGRDRPKEPVLNPGPYPSMVDWDIYTNSWRSTRNW